jgi:hypothetical protein
MALAANGNAIEIANAAMQSETSAGDRERGLLPKRGYWLKGPGKRLPERLKSRQHADP